MGKNHSNTIDFKAELNDRQFQAVTHPGGPLLILAGAGSGKTRALTYRAAYLIQERGVDPNSILLLTFTNKAAEEMQHRLKHLVGVKLPFAGTFHSFCAKLLRTHGHHLGLSPNYLIYDTTDQLALIKQIIKEQNLPKEFRPRSILGHISNAKNELLTPKAYQNLAQGYYQEHVATLYRVYQDRLFGNDALDFDDLLVKTVQLLVKSPQVAQKLQTQFEHVLIDEYQDTNKAQYQIAKIIAAQHHNLTAVGDASQSIYRWRGADYRNLDYLKTDFPDLTTIKLEQNYRSTQPILDAAYSVISKNHTHPILSLWTNQTEGDPLILHQADDEYQEARYVINSYQQVSGDKTSTAVLYRTNAQSRAFEEACIRAGIPYLLVGGVKFYDRKEIKDVLAYLRLLINPTDEVSLNRAEKLGKRRFQSFLAKTKNIDVQNTTTTELFEIVLASTNYMDKLDPHNESDLERIENIKELKSVATQFDHLVDFLENVSLVETATMAKKSALADSTENPLVLMTMHASKGLEFDQVFVVGLEEGVFPHSRTLLDPQELEEERRLCYVALTRARKYLHLTHARNRNFYGGRQTGTSSRFISEIPEHLLRPTSPVATTSTHHYQIDEDLLDQFLDDEIDIDQFLN